MREAAGTRPAARSERLKPWGTLIDKGRRNPPLFVLAALSGALSWGHGLTPLAALAVLAWAYSTGRRGAWFTMFGYYLGGSWVIPGAAVAFFGEASSLAEGVALWVASSALLALPWAAFAPSASPLRTLARLAFALAAVSMPPLGVIGWMNPWLGAALIIPSFGWLSLGWGLLALALYALLPRLKPPPALLAVAIALPLVAGLILAATPTRTAPEGWWGAQVQAGRTPTTAAEQGARQRLIVETVDQALAAGQRVIVLPEHFLGRWSDSWQLFLKYAVGEELRRTGATLMVGAEVPADTPGRTHNAAIAYDGTDWQVATARFAMPVSMWRPWSAQSAVVSWRGDGIYELAGRRFMLSLCFEDVTMWLPLQSFASSPDLVVSMANAWWATRSPQVVRIQRSHIEAWARIFDVPLVRALNAP